MRDYSSGHALRAVLFAVIASRHSRRRQRAAAHRRGASGIRRRARLRFDLAGGTPFSFLRRTLFGHPCHRSCRCATDRENSDRNCSDPAPVPQPASGCRGLCHTRCLSGGRLQFGIGHGFVKWEALTFGIPLDELRDRFRENLEVILKAWSEPVLNHKGHFHEFNGVQVWPRPVQEPYPTVWMAATTSVESFELSGRYGFHMMLIPFLNEVEELRHKMQAYFSARRAAGFDPSTARVLGVYHMYVGDDSAGARAAATQGLAEYHSAASHAHSLTPGMADPESYRSHEQHRAKMKLLTYDELVDQNRVLVGSSVEVRDKVEYVRERLYLTDLAGNFALGGLTDDQARASMRRFMEQVAPKVRE